VKALMNELTFADYLDKRRATYTEEWTLLQEIKGDPAFRSASSLNDVERFLNARNARFGVRQCARSAWAGFQSAKRIKRVP
jgi:hypothetical protein